MKNYLRFVFFIFLFSFFGCSGSVDENLYSSVSFEITIPDSIGKQDSKIARSVTTEELTLVVNLEIQGSDKLRTIEKNVFSGESVTISFDEIPVESNIRVKGELSNADEVLLYSGESEWQKILAGKNSVDLKMKKVITEDDTEGGDNTGEGDNTEGGDNAGEGDNTEGGDNTGEGDNTEGGDNTGEGDNTEGGDNTGESEEIINAANPSIVTRPTNIDLLYGLDTENPVLQISAKSEDGGVVSFQWQVKNVSGEWEVVESTSTENATLFNCSLTVPLDSISLNETKAYKCIVTNTNETVNGIKTAFVEVPVEVSLKQGTVLNFTTDYSGTYELYGKEFGSSDNKDYSSIKIVEYYTRPNGNQESRMVSFDENRYNITSVQNAVGYVPYTITNITSKVTSEVRVPVKYSLEKATVSVLNSSGSAESSIAQYTGTEKLTANIELPSSDSESNGILLYSSTEATTPSNFLINENVKVAWSARTVGESRLSVVVDNTESKTYKATVTPKEDSSWCVGEIVSNEYSVTVEPWKIEINNSEFIDGKYVIDINAKECVLLASNSAYPDPIVTFESKNNKFNIDENVVHISTSENTIEDVITATVDNTVIGSISIILPGITNAAEPLLVGDFESKELIYPVDTEAPVLNISAKSTDGGVITFQWKVQNANGEWENVEVTNSEPEGDVYTSILTVPLSSFDINETKTYKCIVTNTNENANGTKTSSIEKEATIKYVEGSITGITAKYDGDYELYGSESDGKIQDFSKIKITEFYTSDNGETGQRTVVFNQEDYTISDGENAVGYVPYTINYINSNLTAEVRVPVKYKLSRDEILINHSSSGTTAEDSGKIEFIKDSENCSLNVNFNVDSIKLQVYKTGDSTETEMYSCDENEVSVEWNQGTDVEGNPFAIYVDVSTVNEQTYTATISPKNDGWLVCDDGSISLSKTVSIIESSVITEPDGTQENPFTNWDQLVASVSDNQSVTAYITGDITASTSEIIVGGSSSTCKTLEIFPVGNVKITRTGSYKMFDVQDGGTLSIVGNENEKITFDGANITAGDSMFGINNTSANFSYCDFKNTNLNMQDDGAVLYITDTAGNTCVNIENCTFENNSNCDVYVQNCPSLILDGNVQIPSLYFRNEYVDSSMKIGIGNNLSGSVTIKADDYEALDVFNLSEGTVFPVDVFSLADSNYRFTTDGQVESVSGDGSDSTSSIVDFSTLKNAIANATGTEIEPYVIKIAANDAGLIDIIESITIQSHIKLVPAGSKKITLSRNAGLTTGNLFVVSANASLTIGDASSSASIIIDGGSGNSITSTKSLINVASGGTLVLNENSVLQNNLCNGTQGGAVYSNGGTINIYGGYISSNTIDDTNNARYGGGIYLKNGSFTMTSGKFSSNSISSNDSEKSAYGGALALENCTVNISGGEFTANFVKTNTTECYGGAIYILGSSSSTESNPHSISNCTFTANSAYQRGAAIYGAGSGYLNIKNCNFSNNTISNDAQGLQTGGTIYKGNGSSITILIDGENKFDNTQVWNP